MNADMSQLCNPETGKPVEHIGNDILDGDGNRIPVINGIPRFVAQSNYSDDFGAQWNRFPKTQLDSFTGLNITE